MTEASVPADVVAELRSVCLGLPESYEEQAWVGTRWWLPRSTGDGHSRAADAYAAVVGDVDQEQARASHVVTLVDHDVGRRLDVMAITEVATERSRGHAGGRVFDHAPDGPSEVELRCRHPKRENMMTGMDDISACLLAISDGNLDTAIRHARSASDRSSSGGLGSALLRFLEGGRTDVYADPVAFERFIDGGGNVALYRDAHAALAAAHERDGPASVLDIGCGDGRLTTAAIHPGLARVDLVEPSAELLTAAQARLAEHDVSVVAHGCTAQDLVDALSSGRDPAWPDRWDSAQSTFALHTLPPEDRQRVLHLLARRVGRLIVVEFDVPAFADRSAQHARYAAERYAAGVAEYEDDAVVVDGFLMPVLVGQFDPARPRHTWEQPIAEWIAALQRAGFAGVRAQPVSDYWWAPAHLVEATSNGGPDLTRWR